MSFAARYQGTTCHICGEPVKPGQMADYDETGLMVHARCPEDPDSHGRHERRCGECYMIHAGDCI